MRCAEICIRKAFLQKTLICDSLRFDHLSLPGENLDCPGLSVYAVQFIGTVQRKRNGAAIFLLFDSHLTGDKECKSIMEECVRSIGAKITHLTRESSGIKCLF